MNTTDYPMKPTYPRYFGKIESEIHTQKVNNIRIKNLSISSVGSKSSQIN